MQGSQVELSGKPANIGDARELTALGLVVLVLDLGNIRHLTYGIAGIRGKGAFWNFA